MREVKGTTLKKLRHDAGMTQFGLSEAAGLCRHTVSRIERKGDGYAMVKEPMIESLAATLGCDFFTLADAERADHARLPIAPALPLMRAYGIMGLARDLAERTGVDELTYRRRLQRFSDGEYTYALWWMCDEIAVALHKHPIEIWGEDWVALG